MSANSKMIPPPVQLLTYGEVALQFVRIGVGDPSRGMVPYYNFRILRADGSELGHINFRVGDTEHVQMYAGHIGFEILEASRGHGYAGQACRALAPFVRQICKAVIMTCDPENLASRRTIERLGATFLEEVEVPPHDPQYQRGSRTKRRYRWVA